jgi:hypothetical protein
MPYLLNIVTLTPLTQFINTFFRVFLAMTSAGSETAHRCPAQPSSILLALPQGSFTPVPVGEAGQSVHPWDQSGDPEIVEP